MRDRDALSYRQIVVVLTRSAERDTPKGCRSDAARRSERSRPQRAISTSPLVGVAYEEVASKQQQAPRTLAVRSGAERSEGEHDMTVSCRSLDCCRSEAGHGPRARSWSQQAGSEVADRREGPTAGGAEGDSRPSVSRGVRLSQLARVAEEEAARKSKKTRRKTKTKWYSCRCGT